MPRHKIRIVHKYRTQDRRYMLDAAVDFFSAHGVDPRTMSRVVENDCVELEGQGAEFAFMRLVAPCKFDLTLLEISEAAFSDYDAWLDRYFFNSDFVMAWVVDAEDDSWQNQKRLEIYDAAGRSHAHLTKISNGLPAPVNLVIIDTSSNPGRWTYRQGYVDAVGSPMWVSKAFWELSGGARAALLEQGWLTPVRSDIDKIQPLDRCFLSTQPGDATIQNSLRSILFRS